MQSLGTWFSGGIDSVSLVDGLDDLEALLQPQKICDSMIYYYYDYVLFVLK